MSLCDDIDACSDSCEDSCDNLGVAVGPAGPRGATGSSGSSSIIVDNTVFIRKDGDDATGICERQDKPFLTYSAARAAAILFWTGLDAPAILNRKLVKFGAGNWDEQIVLLTFLDIDLGNATLSFTSVSDDFIITDGGVASDNIIYGKSHLRRTMGAANAGCILTSHASSLFMGNFTSIIDDGDAYCIKCSAGAQIIRVDDYIATTTNVSSCSVSGSGSQIIYANQITGANASGSSVQLVYAEIVSAGAVCVNTATQTVYGNAGSIVNQGALCLGGVQTIYGDVHSTVNAAAGSGGTGTQKIKGNVSHDGSAVGNFPGADCQGSSIQEIDGNISTNAVGIGSYGISYISSGTSRYNGDVSAATSAGIYIFDGTVIIGPGSRVTTTNVNEHAIIKDGGVLIIDNVTLIANGIGNSIFSAAPQNVLIYGTPVANTAVAGTITQQVGAITVSALVV